MGRRKHRTVPTLPAGERVLAFDIASASGYAFGIAPEIIKYGKYTIESGQPVGQGLLQFSKWLAKVINDLPAKPEVVVVESPFLGRNAHTYAVLNRYIGIVQREVFRILGCDCQFISPKAVKARLKLPKTRSHKQNKINMIRKINALLGTDFKYVSGRGKKAKRSDDDIADAIGLLMVYWLKNNQLSDATEG
jgi:Holliday junction resolvasome RuvABC endonuclease subunit